MNRKSSLLTFSCLMIMLLIMPEQTAYAISSTIISIPTTIINFFI